MKLKLLTYSICLSFLLSGCYSFTGTNFDPNIKTYYVEPFRNNASNAIPALEQTVTENFKEKIRTESRLLFADTNPDIEFKGTVVDYRISSEAPAPGEFTALNRLTIVVAVEYINNFDEEKGWKKNFSHFVNFDSSEDITSIQDDLVAEILDQILEDIFNKAFTDW